MVAQTLAPPRLLEADAFSMQVEVAVAEEPIMQGGGRSFSVTVLDAAVGSSLAAVTDRCAVGVAGVGHPLFILGLPSRKEQFGQFWIDGKDAFDARQEFL